MHQHDKAVSASTVIDFPMAWATLPDVDDVKPRGPEDEALFAELREVLARHGALARFGIALNHRHFDLLPGEVIFESTDADRRQQIIEPRQAADVLTGGFSLETQWMFDAHTNTTFCVGHCHYDRGHKRHHQKG